MWEWRTEDGEWHVLGAEDAAALESAKGKADLKGAPVVLTLPHSSSSEWVLDARDPREMTLSGKDNALVRSVRLRDTVPVPVTRMVSWEWGEGKGWWQYSAQDCAMLEEMYAARRGDPVSVKIKGRKATSTFDFHGTPMTECDHATNRPYYVRRDPRSSARSPGGPVRTAKALRPDPRLFATTQTVRETSHVSSPPPSGGAQPYVAWGSPLPIPPSDPVPGTGRSIYQPPPVYRTYVGPSPATAATARTTYALRPYEGRVYDSYQATTGGSGGTFTASFTAETAGDIIKTQSDMLMDIDAKNKDLEVRLEEMNKQRETFTHQLEKSEGQLELMTQRLQDEQKALWETSRELQLSEADAKKRAEEVELQKMMNKGLQEELAGLRKELSEVEAARKLTTHE
eukprot:Hpha_TRINITY_DN15388_c1_g1::TRINITY_DN15388_c1_g1_i1::g.87830::m.87830